MSFKRVLVTGLGVVSPVGCNVSTFWNSLLQGKCSFNKQEASSYQFSQSKFAGLVDNSQLPPNDKKLSRCASFALHAADQALEDASFKPGPDTSRVGVLLGVGLVSLSDVYEQWKLFSEKGYSKVSPWFVPKILPNQSAGVIAMKHKIHGMVHCVSTACATGAHSIGDAFRLIKTGELDAIIVGASDSSMDPLTVAGFGKMRALSTAEDPLRASTPFDKDRCGFVLAEGAAVCLLESEEHAVNRKVKNIYAEVLGYGYSSDAYHIASPHPDGLGAIQSMNRCLNSAAIKPSDVDYICAHATSTPAGDVAEAKAIANIFSDKIPYISSIKGSVGMFVEYFFHIATPVLIFIGHLLGGAGSLESVATLLAIYHKTLPGTTGLTNIDKDVPDNVKEKLLLHGKTKEINSQKKIVALKNSFGFFGANASLCFSEYRP